MVKVTKETYDAVFQRDKGKCALCKSYLKLQLHHINGRSATRTNDIDNCVMLCDFCHDMVHSNQLKFKPILEKYIRQKNRRKE